MRIAWITTINSVDIIKKVIPLTNTQLQEYQKTRILLEIFEIAYEDHHWTVLRTMEQMLDFLQHLQKKYPHNQSTIKIVQNSPVPKILNFMNNNVIDIEDEKIVQFFEIYDLQFNKIKSLKLNKNAGGRYRKQFCCNCSLFQWKKRQFVITPSGIMYYKLRDTKKKVCQYISFNKYFSYRFGMETGDQFGILIRSYHRRLKLNADNFQSFIQAIYYLQKAFKEHNQVKQSNRYGSFAPQRENNFIQFLVDGQEYFRAVAEEISKAKHQIMIAGWWISPEFYLIRPIDPEYPERNRLRTILKSVTENNVKIYVLAYRQSPYFLPNDSNYTKKALESISPNIKVITHPINIIPSLWSHHEKIVIVDQKVAFIGGLDLCYGRYDTSQHSITDKQNIYPGIEFNNSRIKDFCRVREYYISNIMRTEHPRLPWHDVAIKLIGGSVNDVVKHFVQYWNFASYEALYQQRIVLVPQSQKITNKFKNLVTEFKNKFRNPKEGEQNKHKLRTAQSLTLDIPPKFSKNNQPQLQNQMMNKKQWQQERKKIKKSQFESDQSPRRKNKQHKDTLKSMMLSEIEELPGQDINTADFLKTQKTNAMESGEDEVYRYTSDENEEKGHEKQSIANQNFERKLTLPSPMIKLGLKKKIRKISVSNLQEQQQEYDSDNGDYLNQKQFDLQREQNMRRQGKLRQMLRRIQSFDETKYKKSRKMTQSLQKSSKSKSNLQIQFKKDRCQVLRSVSQWSIGCKQSQSESSIHSAYLDMITNAEYFIYIENQFFMSATDGGKVLKNQVAKTLIKRIQKAIKQNQQFRVIFLMPLIPGFAGELDDPDAILPRVILHWQYLTIYQCQHSVIKSLQKLTPNPHKYIQFYGLRTHDLINDEPKTQIVYLHTKLMIIDDRKAIIGSANINDRSMRGTRDSQIAIQITGGDMIQSIVDGKSYIVSEKIKLLRMKLMKQHFGHIDSEGDSLNFTDLLNQKLFNSIEKIAKVNTETYRKLFGCYPDNMIGNLKELKEFKKTPTKQEYLQSANKIKGHAVHFPYQFLKYQNLLEGNSIYPNGITT